MTVPKVGIGQTDIDARLEVLVVSFRICAAAVSPEVCVDVTATWPFDWIGRQAVSGQWLFGSHPAGTDDLH
jgi:hypothetical protein